MSSSLKLSRAGSLNVKGKIVGTRKRDGLVETVGSGSIPASVSRTFSTVLLLAETAQEGLSRRGARTGIKLKAA
jgi:hypothetical protein